MEALRAEISIAELCRKHTINQSKFYKQDEEFLEAGKKRLSGDVTREATSDEVAERIKERKRPLKRNGCRFSLTLRYCKKVWI